MNNLETASSESLSAEKQQLHELEEASVAQWKDWIDEGKKAYLKQESSPGHLPTPQEELNFSIAYAIRKLRSSNLEANKKLTTTMRDAEATVLAFLGDVAFNGSVCGAKQKAVVDMFARLHTLCQACYGEPMLVRYKEKLLLQQMELSKEMHDAITGELDDIWKALTPDERSVAEAFSKSLSKREPLVGKEFFEYLFQVLNYYANESTYQGSLIGGILEGCPRGPAPSPSDLTHTAEKAKALLRIHYVIHASSDSIPVPRTTLQWWRQLVDYNPRDLAPRMDRYLQDAPGKPLKTVSSIFTLDSGWQIPITFDIEKNTFVESAPPELHVKGPELKPGTPEYRLNYLLSELEKRFPKLHDPVMSDPAEPKYLSAIDALIAERKNHLSPQT